MSNAKPKPHAKDLRKGRHSENNRIFLITTVTQKRQEIFTDFFLARCLVQAMHAQQQQQNVDNLAFVIMPDHLLWLFALHNDCTLAQVMRAVKGSSAFQIQKIRRERGETTGKQSLWQKGYHDHAVRKEEDIQQLARHIVANPIRAGLVKKNSRSSPMGCNMVIESRRPTVGARFSRDFDYSSGLDRG